MRIARLGAGFCIVSCVAIWLTVCAGQVVRPGGTGVERAASAGADKSVGSAAALRSETEDISRRLHDLEYPELRTRDPREVRILEALVGTREQLFMSLKRAWESGTKPGYDLVMARYHLAAARAELAWAKQNVHEAVSRLVEAADSAAEMIPVMQNSYDAGKVTLGSVLEAQAVLANAELALIRAEKVAAVAKVDISDIKRDDRKRFQEEPSPDRGPGLVPPPAAETERR